MCRKRGRIVLVGVTGLELSRADFYEKELTFQVSCSYGPGRYDPNYEEKGQDYPFGFVRWTEQRNFEAVLNLMASGAIDVKPLVSHRFSIDEAEAAYAVLAQEKPLGIILTYPGNADVARERRVTLNSPAEALDPAVPSIAVIGAGNYASQILVPAFKASGARLRTIVSAGGVTGAYAGKKYGFEEASTDAEASITDEAVNAVAIATRHNSHAAYVLQAIEAGKHAFIEKPLCLTVDELESISDGIQNSSGSMLMVGFNRRFSPLTGKVKELLETVSGPKSFIMTVNAGAITSSHWTQDPEVGGGRIVGEGCHFIDLLRFLSGSTISDVGISRMRHSPDSTDKVSINLEFEDGSHGVIHYLANGHKSFPKERLEVFCAGRVLQLDNFRQLRGWGWKGFRRMRLLRQDKGHTACVAAFVDAIREGKPSPIPLDEILEVSRAAIEAQSMVDRGSA
jgi:predicted dehydrogenase